MANGYTQNIPKASAIWKAQRKSWVDITPYLLEWPESEGKEDRPQHQKSHNLAPQGYGEDAK